MVLPVATVERAALARWRLEAARRRGAMRLAGKRASARRERGITACCCMKEPWAPGSHASIYRCRARERWQVEAQLCKSGARSTSIILRSCFRRSSAAHAWPPRVPATAGLPSLPWQVVWQGVGWRVNGVGCFFTQVLWYMAGGYKAGTNKMRRELQMLPLCPCLPSACHSRHTSSCLPQFWRAGWIHPRPGGWLQLPRAAERTSARTLLACSRLLRNAFVRTLPPASFQVSNLAALRYAMAQRLLREAPSSLPVRGLVEPGMVQSHAGGTAYRRHPASVCYATPRYACSSLVLSPSPCRWSACCARSPFRPPARPPVR